MDFILIGEKKNISLFLLKLTGLKDDLFQPSHTSLNNPFIKYVI